MYGCEGFRNGGKFQCDAGVIIILWHVANGRGLKGWKGASNGLEP